MKAQKRLSVTNKVHNLLVIPVNRKCMHLFMFLRPAGFLLKLFGSISNWIAELVWHFSRFQFWWKTVYLLIPVTPAVKELNPDTLNRILFKVWCFLSIIYIRKEVATAGTKLCREQVWLLPNVLEFKHGNFPPKCLIIDTPHLISSNVERKFVPCKALNWLNSVMMVYSDITLNWPIV